MVDSLDVPQNSAPDKLRGSKYPTMGFNFFPKVSRSALVSETDVAARPAGDGAKAAAEPRIADRRASFMVISYYIMQL